MFNIFKLKSRVKELELEKRKMQSTMQKKVNTLILKTEILKKQKSILEYRCKEYERKLSSATRQIDSSLKTFSELSPEVN